MAGNFEGIKQRKFGVEIEMTGITRCSAAKAIQKVLGGSIDHVKWFSIMKVGFLLF